jgi:hypothetical protein
VVPASDDEDALVQVSNILHRVAYVSRETGISPRAIRNGLHEGRIEGVNLHEGKPGMKYAKWRVKDRALRKLRGGAQ